MAIELHYYLSYDFQLSVVIDYDIRIYKCSQLLSWYVFELF